MDATNNNVLISENEISYSKSNENENDFINNLYDHESYICKVKFKYINILTLCKFIVTNSAK
jgi:uncharacterized protein YacL (UPF0231 family)